MPESECVTFEASTFVLPPFQSWASLDLRNKSQHNKLKWETRDKSDTFLIPVRPLSMLGTHAHRRVETWTQNQHYLPPNFFIDLLLSHHIIE